MSIQGIDPAFSHIILRSECAIRHKTEKAWTAKVVKHELIWPSYNNSYQIAVPIADNYNLRNSSSTSGPATVYLHRRTCFTTPTSLVYYCFYDEVNNIIHWSGEMREYHIVENQWRKEREEHAKSDPKLTSDAIKRQVRNDEHISIGSKALDNRLQSKELQLSQDCENPWDFTSKIS